MKFEWDNRKNAVNIGKHGVSFEYASKIFNHRTIDVIDGRFQYGETRTISIGTADDIVILTVVHTDRNNTIRIISARRASKKERELYEQKIR